MSGWVKLHRVIAEHELMTKPVLCNLFVWCLVKAGHERRKVGGVALESGQFITGRHVASDELQMKPMTWYDGMKKLEAMGCIKMQSNRSATTVTVCNWSTYQSVEAESPHESTPNHSEPTESRQGSDTEEELKNLRIKETISSEDKNLPQKVASPKTRKRFVPPTVEEVAAFFQERANGLDPEAFVAHYEANGWKQANGNPIKKWQAAVITWEKNREHGMGFKGGVAAAQAKTIPKVLPPEFAMTWEEASTSAGLDSWFRSQNVIPRSYENRRLVHSIRFYHLRKIRGDDAERRVANAIYSDLKTWWSGGDWPNLTRIEDWREAEAFIAGLEGAA